MTPTSIRNRLVLLAALGSLLMILGAWGFQYIGGLAPCKLCYWQRYPHMAAVPIGALAMLVPGLLLPFAGSVAAAATAAVGIYHTGVERSWWPGPDTCSSGDIGGLSTDQLMDQILTAPLMQCDQVAWEMLGLSMASWNALISVGLMVLWLLAAAASRG